MASLSDRGGRGGEKNESTGNSRDRTLAIYLLILESFNGVSMCDLSEDDLWQENYPLFRSIR